MKYLILVFCLLFGRCLGVVLTVGYVTQTAQGTGDGLTSGNAASVANLNANTIPGGTITSGTACTIHLVSTITSAITATTSGTAGNVITYLFDSGAKMSAAFWGSAGAINATNKNYITVDGGTNGIIEATANGTARANQQASVGVLFTNCTNITVTRMNVNDMYVRTGGSSDSTDNGAAIASDAGSSNITLSNNVIVNSKAGVVFAWTGTATGISISGNSINFCSTGIVVSPTISGDTSSGGISINNNTINNNYIWDGPTNIFHSDGIHFFGITGATPSGTKYYNNRVGPSVGIYFTGEIFDENGDSPDIYNNVLTAGSGYSPSNGLISLKFITGTATVRNNTLTTVLGGNGIYMASPGASVTIANNIGQGTSMTAVYAPSGTIASCDYNCWYGPSMDWNGSNWAGWQGLGFDAHGYNVDPVINTTTGVLSALSTPVINKGTTQAGFSTDILGTARPQSTAWDIGAYEYIFSSATGSSLLSGKISLTGKVTVK